MNKCFTYVYFWKQPARHDVSGVMPCEGDQGKPCDAAFLHQGLWHNEVSTRAAPPCVVRNGTDKQ
jgi:hypothetical protein